MQLLAQGEIEVIKTKKVFICYAKEDFTIAKKLYNDLKRAGFNPWLDTEVLLPGQPWKLVINQAIKESSYFLALLSSNSVTKKGFVQKELKMGLDILEEFPESKIFIIPVRLDNCEPINEKLKNLSWADLFSSYKTGLKKILCVLENNNSNKKTSTDVDKQSLHIEGDSLFENKKPIKKDKANGFHTKIDSFHNLKTKTNKNIPHNQYLPVDEEINKTKLDHTEMSKIDFSKCEICGGKLRPFRQGVFWGDYVEFYRCEKCNHEIPGPRCEFNVD